MICRTIIKYWDDLPGDRVETLLNDFEEINGYELDNFDEMYKYIDDNEDINFIENSHSQVVVDAFASDYMSFIVMWRQHFLDSMHPEFMPDGWDVEYSDFYKVAKPLDMKNYDSE